jgi:hypothetical protein
VIRRVFRGGSPRIEPGGFIRRGNETRQTQTYLHMHATCHSPSDALNHLGILSARRPSPDTAPHPWTRTMNQNKCLFFIKSQNLVHLSIMTKKGFINQLIVVN